MLIALILAAIFVIGITMIVLTTSIETSSLDSVRGIILLVGTIIGFALLLTALFLYTPGAPSKEFPKCIWRVEWVKGANQNVLLVLCTKNCSSIRLIQVRNDKIPEVSPGDLLIWDEKTEKAVKVQ